MEIRKANSLDTPGIIKVLKASLGESKLKKTETIWDFKHKNNPFGKSVVLVAVENGEIIGVRAFMRWNWRYGSKVFSAFRAVDTATHPNYQGKGIFRKLTTKGIELAKEKGKHFIFNTPNSKSKPGYLKMGWREVGKLKVQLTPMNPFGWSFKLDILNYKTSKSVQKDVLERLVSNYNYNQRSAGKLFTPKTSDYLEWRYENNPLQEYEVLATPNFYLAAYVKTHKYFKELRVVESIYVDENFVSEINSKIRKLAAKFGVQVISCHPSLKLNGLFGKKAKYGPVLTFRSLSLPRDEINYYLDIENWSYTLGDLELF